MASPAAVRPLIGWMPDALGSWANFTVRRALELTHRMCGHDRAVSAVRASALIELVGLDELADRPTRVPASGLDPVARIELRELLLRLAAEGRTILISSHVLSELDELASDAVYLDHGVTASQEAVAAVRASSRLWRVKALDGFALGPALEGIGVDRARIGVDGQGFTVAMADETDAAAVLGALVAAGVGVSWFAPASGELERTLQGLSGGSGNIFGFVALGVRQAQIAPETEVFYDWCHSDSSSFDDGSTPEELLRSGVPSWFIGLALQAGLSALALVGAWRATRTPAGRLAAGSRIA